MARRCHATKVAMEVSGRIPRDSAAGARFTVFHRPGLSAGVGRRQLAAAAGALVELLVDDSAFAGAFSLLAGAEVEAVLDERESVA